MLLLCCRNCKLNKFKLTYTISIHYNTTLTKYKMTSEKNAQIAQAQEAFQMMHQISHLLNTGLDTESLAICIRLCELGVDPETLAHVIWEIRRMGENASQTKQSSYNHTSLKE